ncbi:MAG: anthranilate synthase component I [Ignavibacteriales bacterium]|nr:anthranilate synthase component I [Ignavibacteriales bacterium]
MTTFEEFRSYCGRGNVFPVFEPIVADTETPVSVFLQIKDLGPYSFLLESVEGGETVGRYSFLGFNPFMKFTIKERRHAIETFHDDVVVLPSLVDPNDPPVLALKKLLAHIRTVPVADLPRFSGGAVGYLGYEAAGLFEDIPIVENDELDIPDGMFLFYDVVLIFDNVLHRLFLVSLAYVPEAEQTEHGLQREYAKAESEITRLKELLGMERKDGLGAATHLGPLEHLLSKDEFCRSVRTAKRYIEEGDIFQMVLSQRLKQEVRVNPFDMYRTLRVVNPSPYMYYLALDSFSIIGSSPEMLVRVDHGIVETRPIAGTRRRGASPEEDKRLEEELRSDEKEKAEHLMLVDLGRNDVGRICEFGSIEVVELMAVERYSHVMHLVSSVRGRLRAGLSALDALIACFPAGTLTGAPKIRAMEIIAELEPVKRGVYGGAIAYLDFSGNLDSCIAIRTIVAKDTTLFFQAGAGVVYDSVPEREYEETIEKLQANLKALEMLKQ